MNAPLVAAGVLAVLGSALHGVGGEVLVVRKVLSGALPPTAFGGPTMTKAMLHVTWHVTTVAFLAVGCALLLAGTVVHGNAAHAIALVAAGTVTGFAAVIVGLGLPYMRSPRFLLRHPGPLLLTAVTALTWWGAL